MTCEELGLKFEEVREACNTKWNIEIPEARDGIKGHCLPKDAEYFASLKRAEIVSSAQQVDQNYQKWLQQNGLEPKNR
jgi:UDP-N-acetyl-D-mannosaminuronic acid dehydrogenase